MTTLQQCSDPELHERRQALSVEALEGVGPALTEIDAIETELRRRQIVAEREALAAAERDRRAAAAREQERRRLIASLTQQLAALDAARTAAGSEVARHSSALAAAQRVSDLAGARADSLRGKLYALTQDEAFGRSHYAVPEADVRQRVRQTLAGEVPAWTSDLEALRALTPPAPEPFYER